MYGLASPDVDMQNRTDRNSGSGLHLTTPQASTEGTAERLAGDVADPWRASEQRRYSEQHGVAQLASEAADTPDALAAGADPGETN